jgi:hypothetical protein
LLQVNGVLSDSDIRSLMGLNLERYGRKKGGALRKNTEECSNFEETFI